MTKHSSLTIGAVFATAILAGTAVANEIAPTSGLEYAGTGTPGKSGQVLCLVAPTNMEVAKQNGLAADAKIAVVANSKTDCAAISGTVQAAKDAN